MMNHDPLVIVIGFSGCFSQPKNTPKNILETRQCTVNMVNEDMVEYIPDQKKRLPTVSTTLILILPTLVPLTLLTESPNGPFQDLPPRAPA